MNSIFYAGPNGTVEKLSAATIVLINGTEFVGSMSPDDFTNLPERIDRPIEASLQELGYKELADHQASIILQAGAFKPGKNETPDSNGYYWRTIRGRKVPFREGEDFDEKMKFMSQKLHNKPAEKKKEISLKDVNNAWNILEKQQLPAGHLKEWILEDLNISTDKLIEKLYKAQGQDADGIKHEEPKDREEIIQAVKDHQAYYIPIAEKATRDYQFHLNNYKEAKEHFGEEKLNAIMGIGVKYVSTAHALGSQLETYLPILETELKSRDLMHISKLNDFLQYAIMNSQFFPKDTFDDWEKIRNVNRYDSAIEKFIKNRLAEQRKEADPKLVKANAALSWKEYFTIDWMQWLHSVFGHNKEPIGKIRDYQVWANEIKSQLQLHPLRKGTLAQDFMIIDKIKEAEKYFNEKKSRRRTKPKSNKYSHSYTSGITNPSRESWGTVTSEQREAVEKAFSQIPPYHMRMVKEIKAKYKGTSVGMATGQSDSAKDNVVLAIPDEALDAENTAAHEVAHVVWDHRRPEEKEQWVKRLMEEKVGNVTGYLKRYDKPEFKAHTKAHQFRDSSGRRSPDVYWNETHSDVYGYIYAPGVLDRVSDEGGGYHRVSKEDMDKAVKIYKEVFKE